MHKPTALPCFKSPSVRYLPKAEQNFAKKQLTDTTMATRGPEATARSSLG